MPDCSLFSPCLEMKCRGLHFTLLDGDDCLPVTLFETADLWREAYVARFPPRSGKSIPLQHPLQRQQRYIQDTQVTGLVAAKWGKVSCWLMLHCGLRLSAPTTFRLAVFPGFLPCIGPHWGVDPPTLVSGAERAVASTRPCQSPAGGISKTYTTSCRRPAGPSTLQ